VETSATGQPKANPLAELRGSYVDSASGQLDYERVLKDVIGYIGSEDPTLDLSDLRSIRASTDYPGLLQDISAELGRTITATERADGSGQAMLVHGNDGDILALSAGFLEAVFHADADTGLRAVNTIHHELAHAHDAAAKRRNFGAVWLAHRVTGASCYTLPCAEAVWSEYFADRRSYPTNPGGEPMHAAMLAAQIPAVESKMKATIGEFRNHGVCSRLLSAAIPEVHFLFMLAGYVLGTVAGAARPIEEIAPGVLNAVRATYFEPAWQALTVELDRMYQAHGRWVGIEAYAPLEQIVGSVIARLGVEFEPRNGELYVNVPFRPSSLA
jgi:hypothetical protein